MPKISIDSDEYYPFYGFKLSTDCKPGEGFEDDGEPWNSIDEKYSVEIPAWRLEWLRKVGRAFEEAQAYLKSLK